MSTSTKISVTISAELLGQIDDIRYGDGLSTRSAAITYMLEEALRFWDDDELAIYRKARMKGACTQPSQGAIEH